MAPEYLGPKGSSYQLKINTYFCRIRIATRNTGAEWQFRFILESLTTIHRIGCYVYINFFNNYGL